MTMQKVAPIFVAANRFTGASGPIRHALSMVVTDSIEIRRIVAICKTLRLAVKVPFWRSDCWAHIAIPHLRLAFLVMGCTDERRLTREQAKWKGHGWTMLGLSGRAMAAASDEALLAGFRTMLEQNGKVK